MTFFVGFWVCCAVLFTTTVTPPRCAESPKCFTTICAVSSCEVEKLGQFIKIKIFYDVNTFRFLTQANMKYVKA